MNFSSYEPLLTPFAEKMDKEVPWRDYPRPSMVRESYITLNGAWDFTVTDGEAPREYSEKILVPFPPESRLSGYFGEIPKGSKMFYRRKFTLPEGFNVGRVLLHLGACDTLCELFVNGDKVYANAGGYLPFTVDITDTLADGENELIVRATDDLDKVYPYGKQTSSRGGMWYTPVSGIWQSVWLESVPLRYVEKIKITPRRDRAIIEVIGGEDEKILTLDDGTVYKWHGACFEIKPKTIINWTPESPYLYSFTLQCGEDKISSYFALREVKVDKVGGIARILLNGEPYLFNGLLDQGYYPDGLFLPATSEGYEHDILTAKSLGFNMLRKHIKIEPEIFYYLCDKLGMAVFQDMVNNSDYSFILDTALPTVGFKNIPDKSRHKNPLSRRIFIEHALRTLEHLYSYPCIVYYTIFNEGWGQFSADEVYEIIKEKEPERIIDATSGWFVQKKSDVDSRHVYFKPVKLGRVSDRPIVISEFGGYSYRAKGHLFGDGNYGYRLFKSEGELENAFIKLYSEEISPLIPLGISALVYTQVSDIEDETNGVMTYDRRKLKLNPERIKPIMDGLFDSIKGERTPKE